MKPDYHRLLVCFAFRKRRFRFRINLFMVVLSQGRLEGLIFTFLFGNTFIRKFIYAICYIFSVNIYISILK